MPNSEPCQHAFHPWQQSCGLGMTLGAWYRFYSKSSKGSVRGKISVDVFCFSFLKVDGYPGAGDAGRCGGD